jgi:hypothetical protein
MKQLLAVMAATLALAACADDYYGHHYRGGRGYGPSYGSDTGPYRPGYDGDRGPGDGRGGRWRDGDRAPRPPAPMP